MLWCCEGDGAEQSEDREGQAQTVEDDDKFINFGARPRGPNLVRRLE